MMDSFPCGMNTTFITSSAPNVLFQGNRSSDKAKRGGRSQVTVSGATDVVQPDAYVRARTRRGERNAGLAEAIFQGRHRALVIQQLTEAFVAKGERVEAGVLDSLLRTHVQPRELEKFTSLFLIQLEQALDRMIDGDEVDPDTFELLGGLVKACEDAEQACDTLIKDGASAGQIQAAKIKLQRLEADRDSAITARMAVRVVLFNRYKSNIHQILANAGDGGAELRRLEEYYGDLFKTEATAKPVAVAPSKKAPRTKKAPTVKPPTSALEPARIAELETALRAYIAEFPALSLEEAVSRSIEIFSDVQEEGGPELAEIQALFDGLTDEGRREYETALDRLMLAERRAYAAYWETHAAEIEAAVSRQNPVPENILNWYKIFTNPEAHSPEKIVAWFRKFKTETLPNNERALAVIKSGGNRLRIQETERNIVAKKVVVLLSLFPYLDEPMRRELLSIRAEFLTQYLETLLKVHNLRPAQPTSA